jgi:hypothetical protein
VRLVSFFFSVGVILEKKVHKIVTDFLKLEDGTKVSHSQLCKGVHDHIRKMNLNVLISQEHLM